MRRTLQRTPQLHWLLKPKINEYVAEIDHEISTIINDDYNQMLSEIDNSNSFTKLWQISRFLKNRRKQIPPLKLDSETLLTPEQKSDALANQFVQNHENTLQQ